MVIWLRRNQRAIAATKGENIAMNLGLNGDVIPGDIFGEMLTLKQAAETLACEREAILAEARAQAEQLCVQAHSQAEKILDDAARSAQQLVEDARKEYDRAANDGYEDGLERARSEWMAKVASSADTQAQLQQRMRQRLAEIVSAAVEQIVSVQSRDALFERAVVTIERIVDGATYLRVAVHPQDFDRAQATFERFASRWREAGYRLSVSVTADKRLPVGSCLCESDCGTIDASLDTQLRAMRNAVSRALNKPVNANSHNATGQTTESLDSVQPVSQEPTRSVSNRHDEVADYPPPITDGAVA
jgi:type III secretion protein L